jgi:Flp pilus assembly protein TadD
MGLRPTGSLALAKVLIPSRTDEPLSRRDGLLLAAILVATAAVFARGLTGELVYDDRLLIARNPSITDLSALPRLFTRGYWDFLGPREAEYIGYWRPLSALVQALLWPIAGTRPLSYHVVSLASHLGAVTAAFLIARRLGGGAWLAGATALLFGLHPVHVESVAWISALNDPLFGCLGLFSIERFLAWRARGSRGIPMLSLACFSLALLTKELAVAFLPLLVLFDCLHPVQLREPGAIAHPAPLSGWLRPFSAPRAPLRAFAPFAAALALYLVARMLVFASPRAGLERITTDFMVSAQRLALLRVEIFGGALELLTVPLELNVFRPFRPFLAPFDPALVRAAVFGGVYAALLLVAIRRARRLALAVLLVVPAALLPVLVKVQSLGAFPLSDRFLYVPAFGFALGTALFLGRAFPRRVATSLVLLLAGLYAARDVTRIGVWHDEETLFRASAAQSPRSAYVLWGLGRVLLERTNATRDPRDLAEASAVFERAARLLEEAKHEPTDLMVTSRDFLQVNLGLAWCSIHAEDWSAAILVLEDLVRRIEGIQEEERKARELGIRVREQALDLERVYTALAVAQYRSGDFDGAERSFARALEIQPETPETHQNLGRMYAAQGRWEEAARAFEKSSRLRPGYTEDRLLLAQALQTLGRSEEAEELALPLAEELPARAEPLIVLASAALRRSDSAAALTWLERALALEPRNALAWYQKARALLQRDDGRGAMTAFRNAVELDPTSFEAHYDCAAFLLGQGAIAEARQYLVRAYTLAPPQHREPLRRNLVQMELDASSLSELAAADSQRDELEPALAWLDRLIALAPGDVANGVRRARLLRRMERHDDALAALSACAERAPDDFELWSELGTYLHARGRLEDARSAIEHALELDVPAGLPSELRANAKQRLRDLLEELDEEKPPAGGE